MLSELSYLFVVLFTIKFNCLGSTKQSDWLKCNNAACIILYYFNNHIRWLQITNIFKAWFCDRYLIPFNSHYELEVKAKQLFNSILGRENVEIKMSRKWNRMICSFDSLLCSVVFRYSGFGMQQQCELNCLSYGTFGID